MPGLMIYGLYYMSVLYHQYICMFHYFKKLFKYRYIIYCNALNIFLIYHPSGNLNYHKQSKKDFSTMNQNTFDILWIQLVVENLHVYKTCIVWHISVALQNF